MDQPNHETRRTIYTVMCQENWVGVKNTSWTLGKGEIPLVSCRRRIEGWLCLGVRPFGCLVLLDIKSGQCTLHTAILVRRVRAW